MSNNTKFDPVVTARNIIKHHGKTGFTLLLDLLRKNESNAKIGVVFGVSRVRVWQWKSLFGKIETTYTVLPEVESLLKD